MGNRVHKVTGNITVSSGGKLVVQPGAIVKMNPGLSITVNSSGTLEALGTKAQPIVFTSIKDDAHGGDTNGDGKKTEPQPGDWGRIEAGGTVKMDYVTLSYLNNTGDRGAIQGTGGTVTFDNGVIEYSVYECVRMNSGSFTARNSIFREASMGFGYYGGSGTRMYNCIITDVTVGCRASNKYFTNCVFYRVNSITDQGGDNSSFKNCVFYNPVGYGAQSYNKCGSNGNLWADPLFNDPENGDFTLKAGSPCIDAGDGTVAPELDYFGQPRQDLREVADTGTAGANGCVPDIGIHEALPKNVASAVDLVAVSVETIQESALVGEGLAVSWTLRNDGSEATVGSWRDYLYLVGTDGTEVPLGTLSTTGSIAPNGLRVLRATFAVPDVNEGEYRLRVKANLNRDIYEGTLTANNLAVSEATVAISYPKAKVKDGIAGQLRPGEEAVRLVAVEEGYSLALIHAPKGTRVYYSLGTIPTAEMHISGVTCLDGETMLSLPVGEVYLLVVAPEDESCDYDVDFTADALQIARLEPSSVVRGAVSHVLVHGSMFSSKAAVQLLRNGKVTEVPGEVLDDDDILLTLDASDLVAGYYDVKVVDYDDTAMLENALQVKETTGTMSVDYRLNMPSTTRTGRWFTVTLEYENRGNAEIPAPIFHLKSVGRNFEANETVYADEIWLYGVGNEYPYSWLKPGQKQTATFRMQLTANAAQQVAISCSSLASEDNDEPLDLRGFLEEEWLLDKDAADPAMLARLRAAVGTTKGEYRRNLAEFYAAVGYGKTDVVEFSEIQREFFYQAVQTACVENAEESSGEELRAGASDGKLPNNSCGLAGRLSVCHSSLQGKGVRNTDVSSSQGGKYDFAGKQWDDKYNDGSFAGDVWWFHKECNWWHRLWRKSRQSLLPTVKSMSSAMAMRVPCRKKSKSGGSVRWRSGF